MNVEWDAKGVLHPTTVTARIKVIRADGNDGLVQIDTFGSSDREIEGKISQTLQFDRATAAKFVEVLTKAYGL